MASLLFGRQSVLARTCDLGVNLADMGIDTVSENAPKVKKAIGKVLDTGLVALQTAEKAMICASTGEDELSVAITKFKKDARLLDHLWDDLDDDTIQEIPEL